MKTDWWFCTSPWHLWEHELNRASLPGQVESPVQPVPSQNLQMWFHCLHQSWFMKTRDKFGFYHIKFCIHDLVFSVKCVELLFFYILSCWIIYTYLPDMWSHLITNFMKAFPINSFLILSSKLLNITHEYNIFIINVTLLQANRLHFVYRAATINYPVFIVEVLVFW